jgi:hypothetical protein
MITQSDCQGMQEATTDHELPATVHCDADIRVTLPLHLLTLLHLSPRKDVQLSCT